jgi:hypothetical protein
MFYILVQDCNAQCQVDNNDTNLVGALVVWCYQISQRLDLACTE